MKRFLPVFQRCLAAVQKMMSRVSPTTCRGFRYHEEKMQGFHGFGSATALLVLLAFTPPFVSARAEAQSAALPAQSATLEEGESLSQLALRLYGKASMWESIARWNGLAPDRPLRAGQKLTLLEPPTLDDRAGRQKLLEMWRKRLGGETTPVNALTTPSKNSPVSDPEYAALIPKKPKLASTPGARAHLATGQKLIQARKFEEALLELKQARTLEPRLVQAWYLEIRALQELERPDRAEETRAQAFQAIPRLREDPLFQPDPPPLQQLPDQL